MCDCQTGNEEEKSFPRPGEPPAGTPSSFSLTRSAGLNFSPNMHLVLILPLFYPAPNKSVLISD